MAGCMGRAGSVSVSAFAACVLDNMHTLDGVFRSVDELRKG